MAGQLLALAVATLAVTCLGLSVSLIHLRRRHRALRHTLNRVAVERDAARWQAGSRVPEGSAG
jgi:hypothetical protein